MKLWFLAIAVLTSSVASAGIFGEIGKVLGLKSELAKNHKKKMTYQLLTIEELKQILTSKEEWSGVYHLQQLAIAFNEFDNPITAKFEDNGDGSLEYTFVRAVRSNGEIDDGTCSHDGSPMSRRFEIKPLGKTSPLRVDTFEGYLYAKECKDGIIGKTKKIWVARIQVSTTNHLEIAASILPAVGTAYHLNPTVTPE